MTDPQAIRVCGLVVGCTLGRSACFRRVLHALITDEQLASGSVPRSAHVAWGPSSCAWGKLARMFIHRNHLPSQRAGSASSTLLVNSLAVEKTITCRDTFDSTLTIKPAEKVSRFPHDSIARDHVLAAIEQYRGWVNHSEDCGHEQRFRLRGRERSVLFE